MDEQLKQKLQEQKNRIGLVGGTLTIREYADAEHNVSAHITPEGWNTEITVKEGFNPISDRRQRAYAKVKKITNGLETLLRHISLHEFAHWELPHGSERGCPYDIYNHDKILEAVKKALPKNKQTQASYVANAFEDNIINPRCREFEGDFSGQVLFWDNEGLAARGKGQKAFTPFYEAFVKLNAHLWGDKIDKALLKRHYGNAKQVDEAVKKVIADLGLPESMATTEGTERLFNRPQWAQMASVYTKHLAPLLDESPTERLSAFSDKSEGEGQGQGGEQKQPAGNGIEQKMGTREGAESIAHGRYSSNERLSTNITDYSQLDGLYRKLARDISVNVEAMTREQNLAIAPLNHRAFIEERDDPTRIKATKIVINGDGITFGYPNQQLTVASRSKMQRKSFPDFKMIILDNSGSMAQAPDNTDNVGRKSAIPWGDRSKYHFALLGFYGVENFLQRQGIAPYIEHGLSLFSSSTRYKEAGFQGLEAVRKLALAPEWGSTHLDAKVLSGALKGRESFVMSISDGEIANWASEKNEFRKLAEKNHYAHIQIGSGTQFTSDLEGWKLPVFYVNSGQDLAKLMVNAAKDTYRRFTRV